MRTYRYLACVSGIIVATAGTLDELHTKIRERWRRSGFHTTFTEVDTWTEPGRIIVEDHGGAYWEPES